MLFLLNGFCVIDVQILPGVGIFFIYFILGNIINVNVHSFINKYCHIVANFHDVITCSLAITRIIGHELFSYELLV